MEIYLPIVQVHIDIIFILFISFRCWCPIWTIWSWWWIFNDTFLIFLGIPPVYAVPMKLIIF